MSSVTVKVDAKDLAQITAKLEEKRRAASPPPSSSPEDTEELPVLPHLSCEFMLWLWWSSESNGTLYNFSGSEDGEAVSLDDDLDSVEIWLDDRITMRPADDYRVSNVMTGETIAQAPEAKVAIANGKVIQEIRMGMRRDDREYIFGLKGAELALHGVRLPQVVDHGFEELIFERFHLLVELEFILERLYSDFANLRVSDQWKGSVLPKIERWLDHDEIDNGFEEE